MVDGFREMNWAESVLLINPSEVMQQTVTVSRHGLVQPLHYQKLTKLSFQVNEYSVPL